MKIQKSDKCSSAGTVADSDSTVQDSQVSQPIRQTSCKAQGGQNKSIIDINKNVVKVGDTIRLYSGFYKVSREDDGNLWAQPFDEESNSPKLLLNWCEEFEIVRW